MSQPKPGEFVSVDLTTGWIWPARKEHQWKFLEVELDAGTVTARVDGEPVAVEREGDVWRIKT